MTIETTRCSHVGPKIIQQANKSDSRRTRTNGISIQTSSSSATEIPKPKTNTGNHQVPPPCTGRKERARPRSTMPDIARDARRPRARTFHYNSCARRRELTRPSASSSSRFARGRPRNENACYNIIKARRQTRAIRNRIISGKGRERAIENSSGPRRGFP